MDINFMVVIYWILIAIVLYAYIGYGILLYLLVKIKHFFNPVHSYEKVGEWPEVTFITAAYNEEDYIEEKIKNCLDFDYPTGKIRFFFVTDGSDDKTPELIENYHFPQGIQWKLFHQSARKGKIAAVKRVMPSVKTPVTIFTDANTDINPGAIKAIVKHYADPKIGAVAGEKRVQAQDTDDAKASEGIYWKYESILKNLDFQLYSVVGAAGELFSIRTELYEPVPSNSIVEDFVMTMRIASRGYRVAYEPGAYACESTSASIKEEWKRKVRIAAGGIQSVVWLSDLLNIFKYGRLTFQYVSHRVLRWTLAPLALPLIFILNIYLVISAVEPTVLYQALLLLQALFYIAALLGMYFERRQMKVKVLFVPFYFSMMNVAMYYGFMRWLKGNQSVVWEKADRAPSSTSQAS